MGANLLFSLLRQVRKKNDWLILQYFAYALIGLGLVWVSAGIFWYLEDEGYKVWGALASSVVFFIGACIAAMSSSKLKKRHEVTSAITQFTENAVTILEPALQKLKGAVKGQGLMSVLLTGLVVAAIYKMAKHK